MNMPQVDTYGTQQPIALLKLLLEKGGMYDRGKDLNWKMFKDVQFIAAMGKVRIVNVGEYTHVHTYMRGTRMYMYIRCTCTYIHTYIHVRTCICWKLLSKQNFEGPYLKA